jgi:hypothetical protein
MAPRPDLGARSPLHAGSDGIVEDEGRKVFAACFIAPTCMETG